APAEGLEADVVHLGVLAHGPREQLQWFLSWVLVSHHAALALPIDLPDAVVVVLAVVGRLAPLHPTHHARLMPEVVEDRAEDAGGLDPDHLLVIQDAQLPPDQRDLVLALVGVPAV